QMVHTIQSAASVRIEEFNGQRVLNQIELDQAQRSELADLLPTILPVGIPFSLKLCFDPHHRIVARRSDGTVYLITVCFECEQARNDDSEIYDMAPWGARGLRRFIESK